MKIPYQSLLLLFSCAVPALAHSSIFTVAGSFPVGAGSVVSGMPAMVVTDFNRDGNIDIATANTTDGTVTILLGVGAGHFTQRREARYLRRNMSFPRSRPAISMETGTLTW